MISAVKAQDLATWLEKGDYEPNTPREGQVHLFDLREASEFSKGHLPGARHVPASQALRWIPQRALTQELVVLIDDSGARDDAARHVAHELAHHWFRRVRYLSGGFESWKQAGLPIEEGGPTGPAADSFDGTTEAFKSSGEVPWAVSDAPGTPDPGRT